MKSLWVATWIALLPALSFADLIDSGQTMVCSLGNASYTVVSEGSGKYKVEGVDAALAASDANSMTFHVHHPLFLGLTRDEALTVRADECAVQQPVAEACENSRDDGSHYCMMIDHDSCVQLAGIPHPGQTCE